MNKSYPTPSNNTRIGFHYFPDTYHYRESDLITWLPEFVSMGAKWIVLETPADRAIPEDFIRPIISAGIEPILKMSLPLSDPPAPEELSVLFKVYAQWGVHYISLFDRPNTLQAWTEEIWVQQQLVDRFLDRFIPFAEAVCAVGMFPIFPALEPGGNFWDTAFLKSALQGIRIRKKNDLLKHLVIGAYAWPRNSTLNWGIGGPEAWPEARPYETQEGSEDQCGFRIFDWYTSISKSILGTKLPIILIGTGLQPAGQDNPSTPTLESERHADTNHQIVKLLAGETTAFKTPDTPEFIPDHILAGCFTHIVGSTPVSKNTPTWYSADGDVLPIVQKMKVWHETRKNNLSSTTTIESTSAPKAASPKKKKPIKHYLLLPRYEWGVAAWYLEASQPYIQKYSPTIGFSMKEAFLAEKITVVGGIHAFPDQLIPELENSGSEVIQITGSGTEIATQLTIK